MLDEKKYFARGKRSIVYIGIFQGKKAIMKVIRKSAPLNAIKNEAKWLKKLEKYKIGPKLYKSGENYIICEFLDGELIIPWLKKHNKKEIKDIIKKILKQCRQLDKLNVNKKELQRPVKHIIINKNPKMIDFERCKETRNPKNVTQFCQFLTSSNIENILKEKNIIIPKKKIIPILKKYKKEQNEKNFRNILKFLS